ncbi:hypothetical protein GJ496_011590 [Pomphorhynchus laevis]|nr:hypothetical protein GJ496_011590 [Pomphorhynchus laevis]
MLKYKATAATDVTGFGLIGHADNLIKRQKNRGIQFSIRVLPIIQCMQLVNNMMKNMFKLLERKSAETSGLSSAAIYGIAGGSVFLAITIVVGIVLAVYSF